MDRGHAYQSGPDVYFDVDSFGRLRQALEAAGGRDARTAPASSVGEDKDDPLDFALWKGAKPGEPAWDSPWGPGRPGWHIECSAMSLKYLGAGFDIHGGGRDLIFPHHENEIAQAEGALDEPFVRFWMHNGMLNLQRREDVQEPRQHPHAARRARRVPAGGADRRLLGQPLPQPHGVQRRLLERPSSRWTGCATSSGELADVAAAGRGRLGAPRARRCRERAAARRQAFADALADDLNTAAALAEVFGLAREVNAALAAGDLPASAAAEVRAEMERDGARPGSRRRRRRRRRRARRRHGHGRGAAAVPRRPRLRPCRRVARGDRRARLRSAGRPRWLQGRQDQIGAAPAAGAAHGRRRTARARGTPRDAGRSAPERRAPQAAASRAAAACARGAAGRVVTAGPRAAARATPRVRDIRCDGREALEAAGTVHGATGG